LEEGAAPDADEPPNDHCRAAVLMDVATGTVLYEYNSKVSNPPASMTKMMTAMIAMKLVQEGKLTLDDMVPTSADASKIGGSQVYLKHGEEFPLRDMLKAIMISSANDAAYAVAEYIGGSISGFLDLMNHEAASLGMKHTIFRSVHGLPTDSQHEEDSTTALDMALLGRAIIQQTPDVLEYSSIQQARFRDGTFVMDNVNKMLKKFRGMDGIKTGYFRRAGFCITATAERDGERYLAVVMGCQKSTYRFNEVARLLNMGFNLFEHRELAKKGADFPATVPVADGGVEEVGLMFGSDLTVILKRYDMAGVEMTESLPAEPLQAPISAGTVVGEVTFSLAGRNLGTVPLQTAADVAELGFFQKIGRALGF
ncbi:D-alanyl-D-alanine carboxypeptidase, partial [bacterium]|nr:D-alanyl-D-alanine carboxypeptidase [candidate division CSSED10-310 bacterium]